MANPHAPASWITQPSAEPEPSNHPVQGFHPSTDIHLGFPGLFPLESLDGFDLVDPRRNAGFVPHDLALRYVHDTVEEFLVEGEYMTFPVVRYVYRRDRNLRWSEIKRYLLDGSIPFRYPPRNPTGLPWINEPMNAENFARIANRFRRVERGDWCELYERTSAWPVQMRPMDFEDDFYHGPCSRFRLAYLSIAHPGAVLALIRLMSRRRWYLNAFCRARLSCLYIQLCILTGRPFTMDGYSFFMHAR
ncbi:hypothetical protein K438DRAFT_2002037 [Mycena galopus ATCC 62051]|nr:hypothetical protein K438DRAFT_2002037 [Mycena galopus ATCC 62051]